MTDALDTHPIPLRDFFRNPDKTAFKISPEGGYLAFLAPFKERMNLHVRSLSDGKEWKISMEEDRDIAGYFWVDEERLVFLKDQGGDENFSLFGIDREGGDTTRLTPEGVKVQLIDDLEEIPDFILIGTNERQAQIFDPYRLNVRSGEMEMVAENPGNVSAWVTDHLGQLRIALTSDGVNTSVLYRHSEQDAFRTVLTTDFRESFSPQFFEFDNGPVVYGISNIGRDKAALLRFDMESGRELELLYEDPENDISGAGFSKLRQCLTRVSWTAAKTQRHFFDEETRRVYAQIQEQLTGMEFALVSSDRAEKRYVVRSYSDRQYGAYYLFDKESAILSHLETVCPWLPPEEMAKMEPISYASRDGLTIHGYLSLPNGVEARNLPLVVNPHGGPWARDHWGYNPEVQFLASRGYAVLQMNFRGSTSYGKAFLEASFKQWGQAMQDDISDGVNYLIKEGIADPARVAIYGASYGGYATLAGLAFSPELYCCGIDYVGVSNLFTFMATIPPYWEQYLEMLYEMVGHPEKDREMLAAYSPNLHADLIRVPLLIAQGANDPRVKKSESDQMVDAMRQRGIEVEYLVKDNEGHGFRNQENRFEFYTAMERFLAEHMA